MFVPRAVSVTKTQSRAVLSRKEDKRKKESTDLPAVKKYPTENSLSSSGCFVDVTVNPGPISNTVIKPNNEQEIKENEDQEKITEKNVEQRWPEADEPICVVCGRYGAYICDKTENDVCSLECKQIDIEKTFSKHQACTSKTATESSSHSPKNIECNSTAVNPDEFSKVFLKNFHFQYHPVIAKLETDKLEFLKDKFEIKLQGEDLPRIVLEFRHCRFQPKLEENLVKNNYLSPTPIQMQAIPIALSNRDLLACAQTGTGKSASFLLPIINRISSTTGTLDYDSFYFKVPLALVLCPTRELGVQIENQAKMFSQGLKNLKTALLIGGNPLPQQVYRLKQGVQIIIATPGRLCEILEKHDECCNLQYVQSVVLDEVDSILQLGFQAQVEKILEYIPDRSQKMMFSATIPSKIEKIATNVLKNPIFLSVGSPSTPNKHVKQIVLWVEDSSKKKTLFDIINGRKHFCSPAVIFVDSKLGADMLADAVNKVCNISCASVHGDKFQSIREQTLDDFLKGAYQVLVSTSLLGRGIDLLNVKMVINFDMPATVEEYIHQVGRAGKLDKKGFAITFINNANRNLFLNFTEMLHNEGINIPVELMNSPYLKLQKERRDSKNKGKTKKRKDELVTNANLEDLLKQYSQKRKR